MAQHCDEHFTWVACKPGWPGAYAAHTDDAAFRKDLANFKRREKAKGAVVKRVTCNEARTLMDEFIVWFDKRPAKSSGDND